MAQNLQFNSDKTEVLTVGPEHLSHELYPFLGSIASNIKPTSKNLGVIFDSLFNFGDWLKNWFRDVFTNSGIFLKPEHPRILKQKALNMLLHHFLLITKMLKCSFWHSPCLSYAVVYGHMPFIE